MALDYVEDGTWNDPAFIETLRASALSCLFSQKSYAVIRIKKVHLRRYRN
jgi:hypothetical protein